MEMTSIIHKGSYGLPHSSTVCFAQMLLPISVTAKGILWTVLFGLAKTCQYGGLTILGVEGYKRLKDKFKHKN